MNTRCSNLCNSRYLLLSLLVTVVASVGFFFFQGFEKLTTSNQASRNVMIKMSMLNQDTEMIMNFEDVLAILDQTPYHGTWVNDMKQSKLLESDEGAIRVKTVKKNPYNATQGYFLEVNIFDGPFRDNGHYEIMIESSFIRNQFFFTGNQCIFQSKSHLIGTYRKNNILFQQKPQTLFIEKLKFRVSHENQKIQVQVLIGAQSELNIISNKMTDENRLSEELYLAVFIFVQILIEVWTASHLLKQLVHSDVMRRTLSANMMEYVVAFDLCRLGGLLYLFFSRFHMKFISAPIFLLMFSIGFQEMKIIHIISPISEEQSRNQDQSQQSSSGEEKNLMKYLHHYYRSFIKGIALFFLFYLNNMHNFLFFVYFGLFIFPQIYDNFHKGAKIMYKLEWLSLFMLSKVLVVIPLRLFSFMFKLEPSLLFVVICFGLVLFQILLLYLQMMYGSRSIVPKFLTPKGLTEFKFYMIQDQNHICFHCQNQLKELPPSQQLSGQEIQTQNKIVVTPCDHKFHFPCLLEWMQIKRQCPVCNKTLPPLDEEDSNQ